MTPCIVLWYLCSQLVILAGMYIWKLLHWFNLIQFFFANIDEEFLWARMMWRSRRNGHLLRRKGMGSVGAQDHYSRLHCISLKSRFPQGHQPASSSSSMTASSGKPRAPVLLFLQPGPYSRLSSSQLDLKTSQMLCPASIYSLDCHFERWDSHVTLKTRKTYELSGIFQITVNFCTLG